MNIHEYQAKDLFRKFGIPVSDGRVAKTPEEAVQAFQDLGFKRAVVKAQVHAGGRGKAGGIKFAYDVDEVRKVSRGILNLRLKTRQTGGLEKTVRQVLIEPPTDIDKEFYLAVTVDREAGLPVIILSPAGGMSIEEVAEQTPELIFRAHFDPDKPLEAKAFSSVASSCVGDATGKEVLAGIVVKMAKLFLAVDASLVEINPLALTKQGTFVAIDAKVNLDDSALYRHPDLELLRDPLEEDPREREAKKYDLSYVGLTGNIGCMVNGAGLAMATMDIIKLYGQEPANFLDVGGNATTEKIAAAFKILLGDKNVKAILINIFGGIVRCNLIADGILAAAKSVKLNVPLVVRLEGTNAEEGKKLIRKSGLNVVVASSLEEAAEKVVGAVS